MFVKSSRFKQVCQLLLSLIVAWEHRKTDNADILDVNVVINWQLSKQVSTDQYHLTVSRSQVATRRGQVFLKLSADKFLVFKYRRLKFIFF